MRLGIVLRRWRLMEERTTRDVAKEMGIPHATLWRFEQGKDVDGVTLGKILNWLIESHGD